MLVLGLGGATIAIVSGDLSVTISGMSLAAVIGILLNLILPDEKEPIKTKTKRAKYKLYCGKRRLLLFSFILE